MAFRSAVGRRGDKLALWGRMAAHYHRHLLAAALSGWAHQVRSALGVYFTWLSGMAGWVSNADLQKPLLGSQETPGAASGEAWPG
jgi:hypothetical protein